MKRRKTIFRYQDNALRSLSGKLSGYFLGGGTALAKIYFHHRESLDLDFFTQSFNRKRIMELIKNIPQKIDKPISLIGEQRKKDKIKIMVFNIDLGGGSGLKIDFIEDWSEFIGTAKVVDGIPVLSLEDIYIRKLYAITGTIETIDILGKKVLMGGRQEAKDFYDLYFLSHTFQRLSDFATELLYPTLREALICWFRSYDRVDIKTGLLELEARKQVDYITMEKHFKEEIDRIIEKEIGLK